LPVTVHPFIARVLALGNVLIVAREEMIAALLALMVEVCGFQPKFAGHGQPVSDALSNGQLSAVLIDFDHPACSEDVIETIRARNAVPIIFSAFRRSAEVAMLANRLATRSFTVPINCERFSKLLAD